MRFFSLLLLFGFWLIPFVGIFSLLWVKGGPFLGLGLALAILFVFYFGLKPVMLILAKAKEVKDEQIIDIFDNQVFSLGLRPNHLYVSSRFKDNIFDLGGNGLLIGEGLLKDLSKEEIETLIFCSLYKFYFKTSVFDYLGSILFTLIRFPENLFDNSSNKVSSFIYLVVKFLLAPLELLEQKFFDREENINLIHRDLEAQGRDSAILDNIIQKIRIRNEEGPKFKNFSFHLVNKFSLFPYRGYDLFDLLFGLGPSKNHSTELIKTT